MELDGTLQIHFEIVAWLLNIIYGPFCEHFCVGTIFLLPSYLHRLHHHTKGSVQLFTDERLELLSAPDVNGPLLCRALMMAN